MRVSFVEVGVASASGWEKDPNLAIIDERRLGSLPHTKERTSNGRRVPDSVVQQKVSGGDALKFADPPGCPFAEWVVLGGRTHLR